MLEMVIDSIRVSLANYQRVVILKEKAAARYLPIWIGPAEADAIAVKLQDVAVPRPLTHDLLDSIIRTLGGSINHITVSNLTNDTFYATIAIQRNGENLEIDARPSDALALAVRTDVPIFAEEIVMEKAGIMLDEGTDGSLAGHVAPLGVLEHEPRRVDEEELEGLSAFKDFVENLDLEDLGKNRDSGT